MNPAMTTPRGRILGLGAALAAMLLVLAFTPAVAGDQPDKKATSHMRLAQNLFDAGRLGEALSTVDKALDEDRKYVQAHLLRGMILYRMGQMQEALKEFDRTLSLDKGYTDARIYQGSVLANLKRNEEAMKAFDEALTDLTYPWPERIHVNIGMLYREMGQPDKALESLKKAVNLNPSYARGYYELGVTYESMGRSNDALRAYQDALVGMEESPDLNLRLGLALLRSGKPGKAREHLEKVIKLSPDGPEAAQARDEIKKIQNPS